MTTIIQHFDVLTRKGLRIIPLRENSKIPVSKGWSSKWSLSESRSVLASNPNSNIGLLLGEIVDVEGDSVEANKKLWDLIGDYPHPCYNSNRSCHHLFVSPDPYLRHFEIDCLEFRGHGHQSVLPPSTLDGTDYAWHQRFTFPIPPMPSRLLDFYRSYRPKKFSLKAGHIKVRCVVCSDSCFIHGKRHVLEMKVFRLLGRKWSCQSCRGIDLRPACRLVRASAPDHVVLAAI